MGGKKTYILQEENGKLFSINFQILVNLREFLPHYREIALRGFLLRYISKLKRKMLVLFTFPTGFSVQNYTIADTIIINRNISAYKPSTRFGHYCQIIFFHEDGT